MQTLEYVSGREQHTSTWENMFVFGLDSFVTREDHPHNHRDGHHNYQCWAGNAVPDGVVFSVLYKAGTKRGTNDQQFFIAVTDSSQAEQTYYFPNSYGKVFITGKFRVIALATTATKVPRLAEWWRNRGDADPFAYALHCANHINTRGLTALPALPL